MEIGSKEHKQMLISNIIRMSVKTMTIGLVIGLMLMTPSLLRENTFSQGLFYAGTAIILVTICYALIIALKKFFMIRNSLKNN